MGNRNLYHFCLAILIFMDITVPLALLAVVVRSSLRTTLSLFPIQISEAAEKQQPATVDDISVLVGKAEDKPTTLDSAAAADTVYVGQA